MHCMCWLKNNKDLMMAMMEKIFNDATTTAYLEIIFTNIYQQCSFVLIMSLLGAILTWITYMLS